MRRPMVYQEKRKLWMRNVSSVPVLAYKQWFGYRNKNKGYPVLGIFDWYEGSLKEGIPYF